MSPTGYGSSTSNGLPEEWVVVLAGGDGNRLRAVAEARYGYPRPKQFCDFGTGQTLLETTIRRALHLVPEHRVVVCTTRGYRAEARASLARYPRVQVVEQPCNRGTAPAMLFSILAVHAADSPGLVYVLPSDHYIDDARSFAVRMRTVCSRVLAEPTCIALLGAEPAPLERGYGWIVPRVVGDSNWAPVSRFHEKPGDQEITGLVASGALVNTFAMVGWSATFLSLLCRSCPGWAERALDAWPDPARIDDLYRTLADADFSRAVLETSAEWLRVASLGSIRWTDIGTPERLERALTWATAHLRREPPDALGQMEHRGRREAS